MWESDRGTPFDRVQPLFGDGSPARLSRRAILKSSLGTAVLLAVPDLLLAQPVGAAGANPRRHFYLYGVPAFAPTSAPSVHAGDAAGSRTGAVGLTPVAEELAALPVKSQDGSAIALVTIGDRSLRTAITLTIVDTASGAIASRDTLQTSIQSDAMLLVAPVFTRNATAVGLILSISIPSDWRTITKLDPANGTQTAVRAATWVSHHALAYFDRSSRSFAGPYHLSDAPSLARINAVADEGNVFLWTIKEAAAVRGTRDNPLPAPEPEFAAFPLGAATPRFRVSAPGEWPVNGEPTAILPGGEVARLVYGHQVEVYSRDTGARTTLTIAPLNEGSAKPAAPSMQVRQDGLAFISSPAIGRAVIADPARGFKVLSVISYSRPASAGAAPLSKAVLSADGSTVYALGGGQSGGLSAYDASSGRRLASQADGRVYTAVYELPSQAVLAVSATSPRLSFFGPSLDPIATADTNLHIVEVF